MYERRRQPLAPRRVFYERLGRSLLLAVAIVLTALGLGMIGYRALEHMSWLDAFLNAAMILSGMGPVGSLQTAGGKLFAGGYALFSGLVFISVTGVLFAPVFHRFIHKFHFDLDEQTERTRKAETGKQLTKAAQTNPPPSPVPPGQSHAGPK
jgi:hypothetical protein